MPIKTVAMHVKGNSVKKSVDGLHHVLTILLGLTVDDGQGARDEVILHVHDHKGRLWANYLKRYSLIISFVLNLNATFFIHPFQQ